MRKVICIIQAHTTSTRLPNKIFKDLRGKTILEHVINRVNMSKKVDEVIIATTVEKEDNSIVKFCKEKNVLCFRGSDQNVLERYYKTAQEFNGDIIVRITSDCPLIEYKLIDKVVSFFEENNYDYVSPSSDLGLIRGLDVEVFSFEALEKAIKNAKSISELEHVTLHMYKNPNEFKIAIAEVPIIYRNENIRLCVDEADDYKLLKKIYDDLYEEEIYLDTKKVIKYLLENNEIREINKKVMQKNV